MHPEILRELSDQRGREMRAQAHQARLVRSIRPPAAGVTGRSTPTSS